MAAEQGAARNAPGSMVAGYREIQEHWGLGSIAEVRVKAKQAAWPIAHRADPREPTRYVILRTEWEAAKKPSRSPAEQGDATHQQAMEARLSTLMATVQTLEEQLRQERSRAEEAERQAADLRTELLSSQVQMAQRAAELSRYRTEQEVIERMGFLGRLAWTVRDRPTPVRTATDLTPRA